MDIYPLDRARAQLFVQLRKSNLGYRQISLSYSRRNINTTHKRN